MSELSERYAGSRPKREDRLPAGERRALEKLRAEAKEAGATLESAGEGGG